MEAPFVDLNRMTAYKVHDDSCKEVHSADDPANGRRAERTGHALDQCGQEHDDAIITADPGKIAACQDEYIPFLQRLQEGYMLLRCLGLLFCFNDVDEPSLFVGFEPVSVFDLIGQVEIDDDSQDK